MRRITLASLHHRLNRRQAETLAWHVALATSPIVAYVLWKVLSHA